MSFAAVGTGVGVAAGAIASASAGTIAAGVAAVGGIAGAAINASAAGKAGSAGQAAATQAARLSAENAEKANNVALQTKWEDLQRQTALQQASIKGLNVYSKPGALAQDAMSLKMGLADPQLPVRIKAAEKQATKDANAEIAKYKQQYGQSSATTLVKALQVSPEFKVAYNAMPPAQKAETKAQIQQTWQDGYNKLLANKTTAIQQASVNANVPTQGFDSFNQPFQGYSSSPAAGGTMSQNFDRDQFLAQNNQTQADTFRGFTNQDFVNSPISGGRNAPDLMANFDTSQFLKDAGGTGVEGYDLTRNFDREKYLAESGRTLSELNEKYDPSAILGGRDISALTAGYGGSQWDGAANATWDGSAYDEAAITAKYDPNAFLQQGGRSVKDMLAKYDPNVLLAKGGMTEGDLVRAYDANKLLEAGGHTLGDLTRDFTMQDYQEDPGYAFRLAQGQKGVENSAAARGSQLSGATLKSLADFNQGLASQEYQNSVNRYNTNRSDLNNAVNSDFMRYNTGQQTLNNAVAQDAQRFSNDQTNLQNAVNADGTRFQNNQQLQAGRMDASYNRFNQDRSFGAGRADAAYNQWLGSQTMMNNAVNSDFNRFMTGQNALNNNMYRANDYYNEDRSNLSNQLNGAFDRFNVNRTNAANVYGTAYNQFTDQQNRATNAANTANTAFNADRANYQDQNTMAYNRLAGLIGTGQNTAVAQANVNNQYAQGASNTDWNYANLYSNNLGASTTQQNAAGAYGANSQAAGYVGQANAINSGLSSVTNQLLQSRYVPSSNYSNIGTNTQNQSANLIGRYIDPSMNVYK